MALRAVRAEFPQVNISVAICTIVSDVSECRACVTLCAFHLLMPAEKRVPGFIVIKFWNRANRGPAFGAVAFFARDREIAMRIRSWTSLWRRGGIRCVQQKDEYPAQDFNEYESHCRMPPVAIRFQLHCADTNTPRECALCTNAGTTVHWSRTGAVAKRKRNVLKLDCGQLSPTPECFASPHRRQRVIWRCVAIGALRRCETINDHVCVADWLGLFVARVAGNIRMAARQGQRSSLIVIESRRHPARGVVTVFAKCFVALGELSSVRIDVTLLAFFSCAFEYNLASACGYHVT
jgi:hypothetical protein